MVPPGKTLGEVTHVELLEKENADAIATIWRDYHEGKSGRIGLKVEPEAYRLLEKRSEQCPIFVMPIHKSPGRFLSLVMQAKLPYVSFTAIDDFRKLQEAATPMMVAAHYPELIDSKGLALVQAAHVDATTAGAAEHLTGQEAVRLVRLCHIFYGDDELYEKFVKPFNHKQKDFDFDGLVAEGATDHAGMLALGDGLAVRPRIARRRCRQVAAGTFVFLVMIKEPILHLSLAFEWALDDAKRA